MRRSMLILSIALSIAVGSTAGLLILRVTAFPQPQIDAATADAAVGYAFYDGVNAILTKGDHAVFNRTIAPGFVNHNTNTGTDQTAGELIVDLGALGQSTPGIHIAVDQIELAPGTLIVSIRPEAPSGLVTAGLPVSIGTIAGGYEVLRLRDDRVTERWSGRLPSIASETFDDAGYTLDASRNIATRLDRIDLRSGSSMRALSLGPSILIGESGHTRVRVTLTDPNLNSPPSIAYLEAGQVLRLLDTATIELVADGATPARLLRFSTQPGLPGDLTATQLEGGATSQNLWASNLPAIPNEIWQVSIGAQHLPASTVATLDLDRNGPAMFWSDSAPLGIQAGSGEIFATDALHWTSSLGSSASLFAGSTASVTATTSFELDSEADTVVWLITALPVKPELATPRPA
ncbi:MAG TPA: hypothetical protein VFP05_13945 [Thermomicrobiales bacterium]|nr:hypothetical protein [Thermomicrobiales bacterium]